MESSTCDGRIPALRRQRARQHHVAVEQRAHRIHQRILLIVALHQHGIKRGDRARAKLAGALHQPRQPREDRGRVALRRGRLAGRQSDLARGHGKARQRIEHQQHVLALRGKELRNGGRGQRRPHAQQRRLIGGRNHHHRARPALFAQRVFKKLAHLAAALAHQAHHRHIGFGVARHHADQRALAHARPAEDAHALPAAHGQQRIEHANARCPAAS